MNSKQILNSLKRQLGSEQDYKPKLRIARTVHPDKRLTLNEVYLNAHQELNKMKT